MKAIPQTGPQNHSATIGFLRRGYSPAGGAEAYLKRLAEGLLERGYRVVLLGTGAWPQEEWPGGEVVVLRARSLQEFEQQVATYKQQGAIRCDLLFSMERVPGCDIFRAGDGVHAAWLEHRKKRESWWKRCCSSWMPSHREVLALERSLFDPEQSTWVIANSELVAREIKNYFHFPASRLEVIPNGVPLFQSHDPRERQAARDAFGVGEGEFVLLFVGSGWKRKGVEVAIKAAERLPVDLWVAGKGPARKYRSKRVHFLGPVKKMELLYAAADLFILPTLYDPFSNASLEALAAGLPLLTTSFNGCSEIIEEGVHGSIIQDPNDADAFADAIFSWQERLQSEEGAFIRTACQERARAFSMERNLNETMALIERLIYQSSAL